MKLSNCIFKEGALFIMRRASLIASLYLSLAFVNIMVLLVCCSLVGFVLWSFMKCLLMLPFWPCIVRQLDKFIWVKPMSSSALLCGNGHVNLYTTLLCYMVAGGEAMLFFVTKLWVFKFL